MFIHHRSQGFIFKKEERGEADLLFTIYTKDFGKLEILGKAVRKIASKLRPAAEIFYLSEIEFIQGKVQKTLTDAISIDRFLKIKNDFKKLRIAYKISEVLDSLIKGQEPDEKIWQLLQETFERLNNCRPIRLGEPRPKGAGKLEIIYYYFFWNLISILGYQPELYHCLRCHKKIISGKNYLILKEGGIICGGCLQGPAFAEASAGKEISPEAIKILRLIVKKDWTTLLKLKFEAQYLKELVCENFSFS